MQIKLDSCLDYNAQIKGNTVTVVGIHLLGLKQGYTNLITNTVFDNLNVYSETKLCPRFLIGSLWVNWSWTWLF